MAPRRIRRALVGVAYAYLASGMIGMAITRFRHRGAAPATAVHQPDTARPDTAVR